MDVCGCMHLYVLGSWYGVCAECACLQVGMVRVRSARACRRVWFVHACWWVWCGCGVCMLVGGYGVGVVCACL